MEVKPCREYGPEAMVEKIVFQFVRSACRPGGNVIAGVSCGKLSPDSKFPVAVVGDCVMPDARPCSAVGSELMNWDSDVPMFVAIL